MSKLGLPTENRFASKKKRTRNFIVSALSLGCILFSQSAAKADDTEWTVTLIKHANKAISAYNRGDFAAAKTEFRTCIGLSPKTEEFYDGLMNSSMRTNEWDQVGFAATEIGKLDPLRRSEVAFYNGMAMYRLNRYDEAVPLLKQALLGADKAYTPFAPTEKDEGLAAASHPSSGPPPKEIVKELPPAVTKAPERLNKQEYLSYETAIRAEWIGLATYEGLARGEAANARWNNAPIAKYHIDKILKGPPLNKDLPLRYEFHTTLNKSGPPAGWKFDEATVMPKKGSQWILFIEFAVPVNSAFETYQGSYGRQEATEENLNKVDNLLDQYNMRVQTVR